MQRKIILSLTLIACFIGGIFASYWLQTLINHLNQPIDKTMLKERWSLMFFGFTHCPDVCPNTLNELSKLQKRFTDNDKPRLLLVSVDPMRDTPEVMNAYIKSFSDDIVGITGELHKIQVLTTQLGVAYAYNALPDESYTVDHSATIFVFNPDGKYVAAYTSMLNSQEDVDALEDDFRKLIKRK